MPVITLSGECPSRPTARPSGVDTPASQTASLLPGSPPGEPPRWLWSQVGLKIMSHGYCPFAFPPDRRTPFSRPQLQNSPPSAPRRHDLQASLPSSRPHPPKVSVKCTVSEPCPHSSRYCAFEPSPARPSGSRHRSTASGTTTARHWGPCVAPLQSGGEERDQGHALVLSSRIATCEREGGTGDRGKRAGLGVANAMWAEVGAQGESGTATRARAREAE